ncbi:DUF6752 domain-containing protein [Nocardioides mangrovicus]|uniref:DUF6752 domain-containing protein n=1 Tax=Nocardioides mangrovicus TaxID=2478913 RepID=UPI0011C43453|nr:DUF6752 domain-containing protein [Nocardioides mangrovicus]
MSAPGSPLSRARAALGAGARLDALEAQVAQLADAVSESRRLNERLSDVLDVMVEVLVPAVDRDEARLKAALEKLGNVT